MKSGNSASVAVGQLQGKVKFKHETIKHICKVSKRLTASPHQFALNSGMTNTPADGLEQDG